MITKTTLDKVDKKETNKDTQNQPVGGYLTQMKELPPQEEAIATKVKTESEKPPLQETKEVGKVTKGEPQKEDRKDMAEDPLEQELFGEEKSFRIPLSSKDVILGIINIVSVIFLIIILFQFPKKAQELKSLRVEEYLNEATETFEFEEMELNRQKSEKLQTFFTDESGIVEFVNELEKIGSASGVLKNVTFANQVPVKDKAGSFGIPIVIDLEGSWEGIDQDLQKIDKLSFLIRPVKVDVEPSEDEPGVILFKYGVILYVNDTKFAQ